MNNELRWASIPGYDSYLISNEGHVMRVSKSRGSTVGKVLSPCLSGRIIYEPSPLGGLKICKDLRRASVMLFRKGERPHRRYIRRLLMEAFGIKKPNVKEKKIVEGTKDKIRKEKTKMIIEKINPLLPERLDNLRWNFVKRGIRHHNYKLGNKRVRLIRDNREMKISDFMGKYGDMFQDIRCLKTIINVFIGMSWRVRTEPITRMTYETEDYPHHQKKL